MKDINLLPKIVKPKNTVNIILNIIIIVFIVILIVISGFTYLSFNSKKDLSSKLDNLEKINFT